MGIVEEYLDALAEPKRSEISTLHDLIVKNAPAFALERAGAMLGYGRYHYRYESGREGTSHRIALSANKTGISLYVSAVDEGGWLAEQAKDVLGKKVSVGKSCIRMKRLADVDLGALATLIARASSTPAPGMVASAIVDEATPKRRAKT